MYCGIDLHSTKSWVAILDDQLKIVREWGLKNNLEDIVRLPEPYREEIEGVAVETTRGSRHSPGRVEARSSGR